MSTTARDKELKVYIEGNLLDGDEIQDYGQMVNIADVYELMSEYIHQREHDAELRGRYDELATVLNRLNVYEEYRSKPSKALKPVNHLILNRLAELKKLQEEK